MPYITVPVVPHEHQITFEEVLFGTYREPKSYTNTNSNTRTYFVPELSPAVYAKLNTNRLIFLLEQFAARHKALYEVDRKSLYRSFYIPKKSGGLRQIDAPTDPLMNALRELKTLLETEFFAMHHTSAFAYVKERCAVDAVKKHQHNDSWWFLKLDFSNFFGNTTPKFLLHMLSQIFPFSEVVKIPKGKTALINALDLCFLNGGLPQGTPISPMLTNLMMIPIDHRLSNCLREYKGSRYIYTRYADDLLISSRIKFDQNEIIEFVKATLRSFSAPFTIKDEKTRFGSRAGKNWNLGVMLNKDNKITIGNKNKKHFRAMLCNYVKDRQAGKSWDLHDVQVMRGLLEYYRSVEPEYIAALISRNNDQFRVNLIQMINADLSA